MTKQNDKLVAERLFSDERGPRVVGCRGEVHDVLESTMDTARRCAMAGAPDGYVVLAEKQRSGRGRTGTWECTTRLGLLISVVLRMGISQEERRITALMGAVAATQAVQHFGVQARIKWPNDVVIADKTQGLRVRKLGGVLVEQTPQGDAAPAHVLGIGLNVNQDTRRLPKGVDVPATSVKIERGGQSVERNQLCIRLLAELDLWYAKLRSGQVEALLARWRTLSCLLGQRVRAEVEGEFVSGEVLGLRATGELILRTDDGGEIFLTSEKAKLVFEERRR